MIARYAEGPMAIWYWPVLIIGAGLSFWPLNLLFNLVGAIAVLAIIFHSNRYNKALAQH